MGFFPSILPRKTAGGMVMASGCGSSSGYPSSFYWGKMNKASLSVYVEYPEKVLPGMPFTVNVYSISRGYYGGCVQRSGPNFALPHDLFVSTPWKTLSTNIGGHGVNYGISGYYSGTKRSATKYSLRFIALTAKPFKLKFWAKGTGYCSYGHCWYSGICGKILETPEISIWRPSLGSLTQKINSVCTSDRREKAFFGISTDYDITGDLILLDSQNNEVFRKSGIKIWQTNGEETRDLKVSIDDFKDAINNPRSVIRPKFHVKVNDYWEEDIEIQTVPIIDLKAPEVELTNVTAPSEFCPGQLELPAAMYSAAKRCKSKVQARISVLDTALTTQDFDLVEGESRGLNTLLNFDWDTVNNICNKLNVLPDSSPSVPVKFELFRYTDDIERRAGINTEPMIPVDTVLRTMRMRRPGRLVLTDSQIPRKAQPGYSTSFSFTLRNEGECTGRFRTTVRSSPQVIFDTEDEFKPGETKTYSVSMVMPGFDVIPKVSINRTEGSKTRNLVKQNLQGILMNKVTKIDPRGGITIRAAESPIRFVGFASGTGLKDSKGVESIKTVKTLRGEKQYALLRGKVNPNDEMNIPASVLEACEMKLSDPMSYVLVNNVIDKNTSRVKYSNNAASMMISRRRAAGMYKDFLKMEL